MINKRVKPLRFYRDNIVIFQVDVMEKYLKKEKYILSTFIILFLLSRLINLTKLPIFNDEAIYIDWGWKELNTKGNLFYSLYDAKQPFLMWIFGLSQKIISNPLLAGRLVSVVAGLLTLIAIYKTAKLVYDQNTAFIAILFYSLAPLSLFYDRQALMESSIAAVGAWSFYLTLKLFKSSSYTESILLGIILGIGFFIKSSTFIFIILFIVLCLLTIYKNKNKVSKIAKLTGVVLGSSQIILLPLYFQPMFWKTLNSTSRFSLTFRELVGFPIKTWFSNLTAFFEISFWQLNPVIFTLAIIGVFLTVRKYTSKSLSLLIWTLGGFILAILLTRNLSPRYIVSYLPLLIIFVASTVSQMYNKLKLPALLLAVVVIIISIPYQYFLLFKPLEYFNLLTKVTKYSQKNGYVTSWNSGYGVPETVSILREKAKSGTIVVGVRLDAGNPESAIYAYFNGKKRIRPAYIDKRILNPEIFEYDCWTASVPIYFVSRDNQMAGVENYFEEIERFNKPGNEASIGIFELKTNCKVESFKLL